MESDGENDADQSQLSPPMDLSDEEFLVRYQRITN